MKHPEYKGYLIVYSPDDGGWYAQEPWGDWRVSRRIYKSKTTLIKAIDNGKLQMVK